MSFRKYWTGLGKQLAVPLNLDLYAVGVWEGPVVPRPLITHPGGSMGEENDFTLKVFISVWLCPGSKF